MFRHLVQSNFFIRLYSNWFLPVHTDSKWIDWIATDHDKTEKWNMTETFFIQTVQIELWRIWLLQINIDLLVWKWEIVILTVGIFTFDIFWVFVITRETINIWSGPPSLLLYQLFKELFFSIKEIFILCYWLIQELIHDIFVHRYCYFNACLITLSFLIEQTQQYRKKNRMYKYTH